MNDRLRFCLEMSRFCSECLLHLLYLYKYKHLFYYINEMVQSVSYSNTEFAGKVQDSVDIGRHIGCKIMALPSAICKT